MKQLEQFARAVPASTSMGDDLLGWGMAEWRWWLAERAQRGADWVPCAKMGGGAWFCQMTCDGGFTSMGDVRVAYGGVEEEVVVSRAGAKGGG